MTTPPRSLPLVALVLLVAVVAMNVRLVAGGKTWADLRYHAEVAPPRLAAAEAIWSVTAPAWWDGSGLGVPLAGEPSHGALYPPSWLAVSPRALDLIAIAHLVWTALGVAIWARRGALAGGRSGGGASEPAALVAGLLAATSGILVSVATRGGLSGIAHLPWIGAATGWLVEAGDRRVRTRAAIALGALLGLVAVSGVLGALVDALALAVVVGARRRTLPYLGGAIGCGLAIGAVQWLPAVAQLAATTGAEIRALPLGRLVELIVPGSFGSADPERGIAGLAGESPWAPSLFVGAPLLALAAVATPSRRVLGALAGLAALALVVGRGGWPAWVGAPELHVAALAVVLAAHAASGLDALVGGGPRRSTDPGPPGGRRAMIALGVGAACTAVALGAFGAFRARHPEAAAPIDRALLDGGIGVASVGAAVVLAWRSRGRATPVVLALVVLPSVGAAPSIAPVIERSVVDQPPAWVATALDRGRSGGSSPAAPLEPPPGRSPAPLRAYRPTQLHDQPEATADAIATLAGTSAWRWGIAAARSEDPARPRDHDRTWLAAAASGGALLDRFGIALAILPEAMVAPRRFSTLAVRGEWALVELPVAPPASVARGWRWAVALEDALALLFPASGRLPRGTTVLGGAGPSQPDRGPPLPCTIAAWTAGDIELACTTDAPGYAVVSSTPAPGWHVTVDDRAAAWSIADVLRRAVPIDAGDHRIHWTYTAPLLGVGGWLAALGVAGLAAMWLLGRRR